MDAFFIKENTILKKIPYAAVLWIKAEGNFSTLHLDNKQYTLKLSLKRVLEQLPPSHFLQIHRAYVVALQKVDRIDIANTELTIGTQKLPIGRSYRDDLLNGINIVK